MARTPAVRCGWLVVERLLSSSSLVSWSPLETLRGTGLVRPQGRSAEREALRQEQHRGFRGSYRHPCQKHKKSTQNKAKSQAKEEAPATVVTKAPATKGK